MQKDVKLKMKFPRFIWFQFSFLVVAGCYSKSGLLGLSEVCINKELVGQSEKEGISGKRNWITVDYSCHIQWADEFLLAENILVGAF